MWQFNKWHGQPDVHGWLFVQGNWEWGATLTWHVVDIGGYYWVCNAWKWDNHREKWTHEWITLVSDGSAQPGDVKPWMVHHDLAMMEPWMVHP